MKILIVSLDSLGDCINNLIFYFNLKNSINNSNSIYILFTKHYKTLLEIFSENFNAYFANAYWHKYASYPKTSIFEFYSEIIKIRKEKIESAIILNSNTCKNLACFLLGIKKRYGWKGNFINFKLNFDPTKHVFENYKQIIETISNNTLQSITLKNIPIKNDLLEKILPQQLKRKNYITIHPFSGKEARNLPLQKIVEIIDFIIKKLNLQIVIIANNTEASTLKESLNKKEHKNILFSYEFSENLTTISSIIYNSLLFIGQDSGPLHLASLLKTNAIGFMSTYKKQIISPISPNTYIIEFQTNPYEIKLDKVKELITKLCC